MTTAAFLLLTVLLAGSALFAVVLLLMRRYYRRRLAADQRWQQGLSAFTDAVQHALDPSRRQPDWPGTLAELLLQEFAAVGVFVCQHPRTLDATAPATRRLRLIGTAGVCRQWPRSGTPPATVATTTLKAPVPEDFFWSRRPVVYDAERLRAWLPHGVSDDFATGLLAPVLTPKFETFVVLLRRADQPTFTGEDESRLGVCLDVASAAFHALEADAERQAMQQTLNRAHEEGMLQISTGIIHNIGNGITVIQIALDQLQRGEFQAAKRLAEFIDAEILPDLTRHLEAGDLQEFLAHHPQGREYLASLATLNREIIKHFGDHDRELQFVLHKFRNVTEIITLQQQFIGELGTENVVPVSRVVADVLKLCQDPIAQRHIELKTTLSATASVLVDPAMLRHLLLLLVKHAIEATSATRRSHPTIHLHTWDGPLDDEDDDAQAAAPWVNIRVTDNGAGAELVLDEDAAMSDSQTSSPEVRDLLFCRRRIEKYGGRLDRRADFGQGTRITIRLPRYDATNPPAAPANPPPAAPANPPPAAPTTPA